MEQVRMRENIEKEFKQNIEKLKKQAQIDAERSIIINNLLTIILDIQDIERNIHYEN